jgi:hypothetical protein
MTIIPTVLRPHIDAFTVEEPVLIGTTGPDGFVRMSPKGSVCVYDDETLAYWDRDMATQATYIADAMPITVYLRRRELVELLPRAGSARFFGRAEIHRDGPVRDKVWDLIVAPEKERDPDRKGFAVLIHIERAEFMNGQPLDIE